MRYTAPWRPFEDEDDVVDVGGEEGLVCEARRGRRPTGSVASAGDSGVFGRARRAGSGGESEEESGEGQVGEGRRGEPKASPLSPPGVGAGEVVRGDPSPVATWSQE